MINATGTTLKSHKSVAVLVPKVVRYKIKLLDRHFKIVSKNSFLQ